MLVQNLFFVCFAATVLAREIRPLVSGGFRAGMRTTPWHAGIYTKNTTPYMQICGGTLISRNVVVSAAHCFSDGRQRPQASNFAVAVGKIYRPWNDPHDTGAQKSDVKEIKIPPRYQGSITNFQDDISLVIVTKEFQYSEFVKPACFSFDDEFDNEQLQEGKEGKVVGWGMTGENSPQSQVLQAATLPSITIDKCIDESPSHFRSSITGDKICAGYNNGTAVCRGDSGGGLVFPLMVDGFERFFLRGIASTTPTTEHMCNIYTWATFTHLLRHEHFVSAVVPEPDDSCLPMASDEGVVNRFSAIIEPTSPRTLRTPRLQRCECTCPTGTKKIRHGNIVRGYEQGTKSI